MKKIKEENYNYFPKGDDDDVGVYDEDEEIEDTEPRPCERNGVNSWWNSYKDTNDPNEL